MKIPERQAQLDALTRKYLTPPPVEENGHRDPGPTPALSDEEVIALCRKAKNAAKFADLFDAGNTAAYDGDDSDADLALLGILKFYTQEPDQLDRIFSRSALYRADKWGKRSDYRRRTIDKALSRPGETYTPPQSRSRYLGNTVVSYDGIDDLKHSIQALSFSGREKPAPRGWLVDNIIWQGHATSWFGEGGVAKSLLALHLALTIAAESRSYWMAFAVKTVPVLYLDFELDADEQHRRALDLAAGMGLEGIPENFYYLSAATLPPVEAFRIAAEECRRLGVGLVIVDSVGFALEGDSETARDVLGFFRACIQPLRDAGASPLLIDHQSKVVKGERYSDKQAFGSVYKTNAVRSSFQIRGLSDQGEITATFTHKKNNFGWKEKDFSLKVAFDSDAGRITVERLQAAMPNPDREPSKKEQVLEAIEELGRATSETVTRKTGMPTQTVRNAISELTREGAIVDTGEKEGRFRIFVTHNHTTKGSGPVPSDNGDLLGVDEPKCAHGPGGLCEVCVPV
ncbi:MAG: AAA family ATPase [Actinomycetota bacterium]|nr:AAA family ATPase [Actinomycetota bacterium]